MEAKRVTCPRPHILLPEPKTELKISKMPVQDVAYPHPHTITPHLKFAWLSPSCDSLLTCKGFSLLLLISVQ